MSAVTAFSIDRKLLPELDLILATASSTFERSPRFVCRHIGHGAQVATLCVSHPRQGLRCEKCLADHLHRHDAVAERTCDRCGAVDEEIIGVVATGVAATKVRRPRGSSGYLVGEVFVGGLGLCRACDRLVGSEVPNGTASGQRRRAT